MVSLDHVYTAGVDGLLFCDDCEFCQDQQNNVNDNVNGKETLRVAYIHNKGSLNSRERASRKSGDVT